MGRAERRKFLKQHPYCVSCERNGFKKVPTTKAIGNTPLCDLCYDGIMNAYRNVGLKDEEVLKASENGKVSMEYQDA